MFPQRGSRESEKHNEAKGLQLKYMEGVARGVDLEPTVLHPLCDAGVRSRRSCTPFAMLKSGTNSPAPPLRWWSQEPMVLYSVCDAESGTDRGLLRQDGVVTLAVSEVISGSCVR